MEELGAALPKYGKIQTISASLIEGVYGNRG